MEFNYTDSFWVDSSDLDEMVRLCKEEDLTPAEALSEVASGWDDCDYYRVGMVEEQIWEEIRGRL